MINLSKNNFNKNCIYQDISTVFDIADICDNYIVIKKLNSLKQLHIYKIEPVTILNINEFRNTIYFY